MQINQSSASISRVFNLLSEELDVKSDKVIQSECLMGIIDIKNVTFGYEDNKTVLNNLNIKFEPGNVYAIVGQSGAGKSTIFNLLLRLWDADKGNIYIDNYNIKDLDLEFLRKNISVVSQESFIINDTVINNLKLDNDEIEIEEIEDALKKAGIYEDINTMPEKLNTCLGERGFMLSGGQKQRISIARALLKKAPIVIFDEATSALDTSTESFIKENLKAYFINKTVIIVSHRMSFIDEVDFVYTLEDEGLIEKKK